MHEYVVQYMNLNELHWLRFGKIRSQEFYRSR
jgi:hypothetical protein